MKSFYIRDPRGWHDKAFKKQEFIETLKDLQRNPYKFLKDTTKVDVHDIDKCSFSEFTSRIFYTSEYLTNVMDISNLAKEYIKEPFTLYVNYYVGQRSEYHIITNSESKVMDAMGAWIMVAK